MTDRDSVPRWLLWLTASVATGWLLYTLRGVLAPFFFAFLIAYMLDPLVDRIEAMPLLRNSRIARGTGIAVLLVGVFAVTTVLLFVVAPMVFEQISNFVKRLPALLERSRAEWEPLLAQYGLTMPTSVAEGLEELHLDFQQIVAKSYTPVSAAVKWLLGGTVSALGALLAALIVPIFAFYLTYDFDNIMESLANFVPPRHRPQTYSFFRDIDAVLGQFFRGQFTVMAILAVLYSVGYGLIGVPLALPIGIMAGLLSFIPYAGSLTALGAALLMTALDWQGWTQVLWVIGVHFTIQGLEGFVITPKVMGDTVGISAIAVMFALLVGGELLGFTGVLLAIPAAAVVKILIQRADDQYRRSQFFVGGDGASRDASEDQKHQV
ncbi:MAG: AI-2E family transporter [Myxococcales bacterium]|nr:AI-2E family transporter [Myxococcales bacterium]MDH3843737.1 AI-2E family transporter [Myxococcales bacterium]